MFGGSQNDDYAHDLSLEPILVRSCRFHFNEKHTKLNDYNDSLNFLGSGLTAIHRHSDGHTIC